MENILWIVPGFAAHEADTSCIPPLQALADSLARSRSVSIEIVALHYPYEKGGYTWKGIPVHVLGGRNRPYPSRLAWWGTAWGHVRALVAKRKPVLVHAFWAEEAAFLASLATRGKSLPVACTLMGQDARPHNRWLRFLPLSRLHTAAVSDFQAEAWRQATGRDASTVIPWGIGEDVFSEKILSKKKYDLLGVGSLIPLKRFDRFLETVEKLLPERPDLRAAIVGSGPEAPRLEAMSKARGLPVEFLGQQPREKALELMRQSRLLLHTAEYESFGYVLAEALACGAAVVSAPVGFAYGHPHIRTAADPAGWAAHCAEALASPWAPKDARALLPRVADSAELYLDWYRRIRS